MIRVLLFLVFGLVLRPLVCNAEEGADIELLLYRAKERGLAEQREWTRLVHYEPRLIFRNIVSLVDDPDFFLAPDGRTDPTHELEATIRAVFSSSAPLRNEQPPQCSFPARYAWLREALAPLPEGLPLLPCPRFDEWRNSLGGAGITLVFPAAYLNNPASMFGHTLLRIDAPEQDESSRLLAYGASYAAATTERNGVVFAIKGIFGGYHGNFSIAPYYKQVSKYSDLENRDIWEYQLSLDQAEREHLIRHLWELGQTYFDYYFFDENCAYHLLSLLEVAKPSLELTDSFVLSAIPSETVRVVTAVPDLVSAASYRPAKSTLIRTRRDALSPESREIARALGEGAISPDAPQVVALPASERARVFELAFEFVDYLRLKAKKEDPEARTRALELLKVRSALPPLDPPIPPVPKVRPDEGHLARRFSLGIGAKEGRATGIAALRPAYHDLIDSEPGYVRGSELVLFDTELRYREEEGVRLNRFSPIRIRSYAPRDEFLRPTSWRTGVDIRRERTSRAGEEGMVVVGDLGFGRSRELFDRRVMIVALGEIEGKYSGEYDQDGAAGYGGEVEAIADFSEPIRMTASIRALRYGIGDDHSGVETSVDTRYAIDRDHSLVASYRYENRFAEGEDTILVRFDTHF